ncbi:MAG: hypothetical protein ACYS9H_09370, partial [Planctomycetota bacterium]
FHFFGECFDFPVQGEDIRKAIMHFLDDSAIAVKDGFLGQITDFCIFGTGHSSRIRLFIAEDQLKQGGLRNRNSAPTGQKPPPVRMTYEHPERPLTTLYSLFKLTDGQFESS